MPDLMVKGILTPIRTGASMLTQKAEQMYNYMFEYESLAAENAQLWSKEIENSTENVEALLDAAYTSSALTDDKLLGLVGNYKL